MQHQVNLTSPACISFIWPFPPSLGRAAGGSPRCVPLPHGTCMGGSSPARWVQGGLGQGRAGALGC